MVVYTACKKIFHDARRNGLADQEEIVEEVAEAGEAGAVEAEAAGAEEADDDTPVIMPGLIGKLFTAFFGFR